MWDDNNADYIRSMLVLLVKVAKDEFSLEISPPEQVVILDKVINHYIDHCKEYKVFVNSTDPFKFLAWAGLFIYHDIKQQSAKRETYLAATVATMLHLLQQNGKNINIKLVQKLLKMTIHDRNENKDHLAIGMNGLYMSFRTANEVQDAKDL